MNASVMETKMNSQSSNFESAHTQNRPQTSASGIRNIAPANSGLLGFVISCLLLAAAWGVVGIGYICIPGAVIAAALGFLCAIMNIGTGFSFLICLGIAAACLGLAYPALIGTLLLKGALSGSQDPLAFDKRILGITCIVAVVGAALAGLGVLLGGGASLALPTFLQFLIA